MNWALYVIAALQAYGSLSQVSRVVGAPAGQPHAGNLTKHKGPIMAGVVAMNAAMITVIVLAAGRLS